MDELQRKDDALFDALSKAKKKRRRRIIRTVVIVVVVLAAALTAGVIVLRQQVRERFAAGIGEVTAYDATVGSISTTVSGSGMLAEVDLESLTVPAGVEIKEVLVEAHDSVQEGDVLATVDLASVMSAMSDLQAELDTLDAQLAEASYDTVDTYIRAGVSGRVKQIYAQADQTVADCMYENGALALLSLDGYMAVDIETDSLAAGDAVTVQLSDGSRIEGTVERAANGTATILVTDNGPAMDEEVTVLAEDEPVMGTGALYIHNPMRITGYAGTISRVPVVENQRIYAGTSIVILTDTSCSANYDALLQERAVLEETLLELIGLYQDGAVKAPFSGSVNSVDYSEEETEETSSASSAASAGEAAAAETGLVTLSPDKSMSVTISVDETDILSLELGQTAQITVDSIGEDIFTGTVTEISRTASSSSGVTRYSAVVTLDKNAQMLAGMTANVVVRIQGVDNAVIIPVEALHQTSSTAYVYTEYNEDTQEFGGIVTVTTGISNSSYVEITSGLTEGDTIWFAYYDTLPIADALADMPRMAF